MSKRTKINNSLFQINTCRLQTFDLLLMKQSEPNETQYNDRYPTASSSELARYRKTFGSSYSAYLCDNISTRSNGRRQRRRVLHLQVESTPHHECPRRYRLPVWHRKGRTGSNGRP